MLKRGKGTPLHSRATKGDCNRYEKREKAFRPAADAAAGLHGTAASGSASAAPAADGKKYTLRASSNQAATSTIGMALAMVLQKTKSSVIRGFNMQQ